MRGLAITGLLFSAISLALPPHNGFWAIIDALMVVCIAFNVSILMSERR
jgi:hypothetical protein